MKLKNPITIIFLVLFISTSIKIFPQQKEEKVSQVRMGFSSVVFQDAKPQDANAAVILWAEVLQRNLLAERNIKGELVPYLFTSVKSIEEALARKEIDMLAITAPDYYTLKDKYQLVPAIAGVIDDTIYEQYILLVRKDPDINDLRELKNKTLAQPKDILHPLMNMWLENSLAEIDAKGKNSFFGKVRIEDKESNAVYSVFFKKADCAIVKRRVFNTICSLNPQIQNTLKIFKTSPDLVLSFSVYRKTADISGVKLFYDVAKNAHMSKEGKNILKVFKSTRLIDVSEKELESTMQLIESYHKNAKKIKK
ncbi:MAG: PhnD/SsuA/transferrin family substrate-binding protein [Melioribacteraceae bacterium]